jgi:uncharacterized protein
VDILWWTLLAATGFGVGIVAGLFGVGGGFVLTPLLILLFHVPELIAIGTGLCQMIGVSVAAQIRYARLGIGENKLGLMMMVPSLLGVGLGKSISDHLEKAGSISLFGGEIAASRFWFSFSFLILLTSIVVYMTIDLRRADASDEHEPGFLTRIPLPPFTHLPRTGRRVSIPVVTYLGLVLGILAGLLGVGGGVILTPLLVYGVGMSVAMAAGTGVTMLLATSLLGTFAHAQAGRVNLPIALTLLVGATFGAQIGALLARRYEGDRLRWLFVGFVALTALAVAGDLLKSVRY